ncbi:MAG: hypothetical protein KIT69_13975, partial [Propionibacteriaceae bacterium]|nr:hypothetical protein [Propionibacteriaceae bacterium]
IKYKNTKIFWVIEEYNLSPFIYLDKKFMDNYILLLPKCLLMYQSDNFTITDNNGIQHKLEILDLLIKMFPKSIELPGKTIEDTTVYTKYYTKDQLLNELSIIIASECWGVYITASKNKHEIKLVKNYFNTRELEKKYPRFIKNGKKCSLEEYNTILDVKNENDIRDNLIENPNILIDHFDNDSLNNFIKGEIKINIIMGNGNEQEHFNQTIQIMKIPTLDEMYLIIQAGNKIVEY